MNDVAINAAQVAISARLTSWGAPHAHERARELVDELLRRGWIPPTEATPVPPPATPGEFRVTDPARPSRKTALIAEIRQAIRDNPPPPPRTRPREDQ